MARNSGQRIWRRRDTWDRAASLQRAKVPCQPDACAAAIRSDFEGLTHHHSVSRWILRVGVATISEADSALSVARRSRKPLTHAQPGRRAGRR